MSIANVLRTECTYVSSGAKDKKEVIEFIAALAKKSELLNDVKEEVILEALKNREDIASTGFENGIAIPHCFIEGIEDFVVGILIEPDGIDFGAIDKGKTSIFLFIVGPPGERARHIKYLSNISHTLSIADVRQEMLGCKEAEILCESFLRHSFVDTADEGDGTACLCHIFIQDEDKFIPILEIVCGTDVRGVSVTEANNADTYLYKMPLFASLFHERSKGFCRIISCAIAKSLANEVIRQIDLEVGGLDKCQSVMVAVQNDLVLTGSIRV